MTKVMNRISAIEVAYGLVQQGRAIQAEIDALVGIASKIASNGDGDKLSLSIIHFPGHKKIEPFVDPIDREDDDEDKRMMGFLGMKSGRPVFYPSPEDTTKSSAPSKLENITMELNDVESLLLLDAMINAKKLRLQHIVKELDKLNIQL